jgi:hypothetical protein
MGLSVPKRQVALVVSVLLATAVLEAQPAALVRSSSSWVKPKGRAPQPLLFRFRNVQPRTSDSAPFASAGKSTDTEFARAVHQSEQTVLQSTNSPRLSDLAWLAGRWLGKWGPRTAEQVWMPPHAGLIVGNFRLYEDDRTLVIELLTIGQKPDGIELRFRHFTPGLVPWEKSAPTVLMLGGVDSNRFVFDNAANGQPKREIFIRVDQDTYIARSEVVSGNGTTKIVDITFHRQQPPAAGSGRR